MSRVTELEKALTTLFRKGTEVGYTETEIDEFLENIDYHALLQAVWNKAETVYAYRADGKNALSLDYRSAELFKQRATLLYEDVGDSYIGAVFAARSMELWLLEDMGFAVVAKFSVNAGEAAKASPGAVGKAAGTGSPCAGAVRHRPAGTVQAELERKAAGYAVCRGGRPNRLTALRKGLKQYGCISR